MSYQEFLDEILKIMKDIYPNCTVEIIDVTKLNNVSLKGLVIRANGTNVVPNIYMESFYKLYKWNWKMEEIVQKIKETYQVVFKERKPEFCDKGLVTVNEITKIKESDIKRGFNLEKDTLFRVIFMQIGPTEYQMVWSFHHIQTITEDKIVEFLVEQIDKGYYIMIDLNFRRIDDLRRTTGKCWMIFLFYTMPQPSS